jgi:hypothetical protein
MSVTKLSWLLIPLIGEYNGICSHPEGLRDERSEGLRNRTMKYRMWCKVRHVIIRCTRRDRD